MRWMAGLVFLVGLLDGLVVTDRAMLGAIAAVGLGVAIGVATYALIDRFYPSR